jgi:septal ring factor EnvC (AmiA/AmiB activator)
MSFWISGAIIVAGTANAYGANRSRIQAENQQREALAQQSADAAAMRQRVSEQTTAYAQQATSLQQQAEVARQQFELSAQTYRDNKLAMEARAKEVQATADEERRRAAATEASALRARTRGGRRSLLSGERQDAELGVGMTISTGPGTLQ